MIKLQRGGSFVMLIFMFYFILMYKEEEEDNDGPDFIFDVFSYSKSI
jgi:hypothetical protein